MARKRKEPAPTSPVTVEFEGTSYSATYTVESKVVKLYSEYGSPSTQVGGSTAPVVARMLFREVLQAARRRGEI
jgi:hypothetical protein